MTRLKTSLSVVQFTLLSQNCFEEEVCVLLTLSLIGLPFQVLECAGKGHRAQRRHVKWLRCKKRGHRGPVVGMGTVTWKTKTGGNKLTDILDWDRRKKALVLEVRGIRR